MNTMSRTLRAAALIVPLLAPAGAAAKDICHLVGRDILGDPITMVLKWPIDPERPPELLERPAEPSVEDLFSDAQGSGSQEQTCDDQSIVGQLNCHVIDPMKSGGDEAPAGSGETLAENAKENASDQPEMADGKAAGAENVSDGRDYDRYVYATIRMRPVIRPGEPLQVLMAHENTGVDFDYEKVDRDVVDRMQSDIVAMTRQIKSWSSTLDKQAAEEIASGKPWPSLELAALPEFDRSEGSGLSVPDDISFPAACGSLILIQQQLADGLAALGPARERLQRLENRKRDLERADPDKIEAEIEALEARKEQLQKAGQSTAAIDSQIKAARNRLEEVENRDDIIEKLDTQIKIARNNVRKLAEPVENLEQRAYAQRKSLNEEARQARLDVIRSDPETLENEKLARLGKAKDAYRDFRTYEKKRAAAIDAYNKGLADFDRKIAEAPDAETRSKLEESKERFQRLYDQWTDQSRIHASRTFRDLDRMLEENAQDGIGPTTIPEMISEVGSRGIDAAEYFEGYDPAEIDRARRIPLSDRVTLGGTASNDSGALQFIKDTSQALQEEREKVILTPTDIVNKLAQVARGETTLEQIYDDQKQFLERYGHYAKGSVVGGAKGVKDLAVLTHDALTYALETDEKLLKGAYTAITGEEIEGEYFGDRKHKALDRMTGTAADAVTTLLERNNAKHGVRNDGQRVDIADVWDDPAKVGDFIGQTYQDYQRLGELRDQLIVEGSEMATEAADRKLASITKGGEKSLRGALEDAGEIVGENADLGLAGLWALDKFGDTAKGLRRIEEGLDTAEDVARATDRAEDLARAPVGDETLRLPEPDLPPASTADSAPGPALDETLRLPDPDGVPPRETATMRDLDSDPGSFSRTESLPPSDRGRLTETMREPVPGAASEAMSRTDRMSPSERAANQASGTDPEGSATRSHVFGDDPLPPPPAEAARRRKAVEYDLNNAADRAELIRIRPRNGNPSGTALVEADSSPFARSVTPSPEQFRPTPYEATFVHEVAPYVPPSGRKPNPKDYFGGYDVKVQGRPGGDGTFRLGERLGGGANTTAYRSRNAAGDPEDVVIRVTPLDDGGTDVALEMGSRRLLQQARDNGARYFSPSETLPDAPPPQIIEVDGKKFLMAKEPMVVDAERMFANRVNNRAPEGAPEANALQELTAAMAVREMNAHGLAWTDHKTANFAIVEDAASPTGYRAVIFDPGGVAPMKGLTAADRAANARFVQRQFDPSMPRQHLNDIENPGLRNMEMYDRIENMRNEAMIMDLVDERPFGQTLWDAGGDATWLTPTTPVSNLGRDKYFELSRLNAAELQDYIRNNEEIARLLAERGRSADDIAIPRPPQ